MAKQVVHRYHRCYTTMCGKETLGLKANISVRNYTVYDEEVTCKKCLAALKKATQNE